MQIQFNQPVNITQEINKVIQIQQLNKKRLLAVTSFTYLDYTIYDSINVGCEELAKRIDDLKDLKVHCFGHIHEGYGMAQHPNGFAMINASVCTLRYNPTNKPVEIEIEL